jgi:hypothetical protein
MASVCMLVFALTSLLVVMSGSANKPRLADFGRESHVTASALSHILRFVKAHGLPAADSRSSIRRDVDRKLLQPTQFGRSPLLEADAIALDGSEIKLHIMNPFAYLQLLITNYVTFAHFIWSVLEKCGDRVKVGLYSDEISTGQVLSGHGARKVQAIYWTIMEFGMPTLCDELAWFPCATLRSDDCSKLDGNMSQVYKHVFRTFFKPGTDLRSGIPLHFGKDFGNVTRVVYGDVGCLLADERAHKFSLGCKGSGGIKVCALCDNAYAYWSDRLPDPTGYAVSSAETDTRKFTKWKDKHIAALQRKLKGLTGKDREALQIESGYIYLEHGFLQDPLLSISIETALFFDWMHTYLQNGVFVKEVNACLTELHDYSLGIDNFHNYLKLWIWPKCYSGALNVTENDNVAAGSASEYLSIMPIFRKYLVDVVSEVVTSEDKPYVTSAMKACDALEAIKIAEAGRMTGEELTKVIVAHLDAQKLAYGLALWIPKSHYATHIGEMLLRLGLLLSTFVHERKHRVVKRFVNGRLNLTSFSRNVLIDISVQQMYDIAAGFGPTNMIEPQPAPAEISAHIQDILAEDGTAYVANIAVVHGRKISVGDVVAFADRSGKLGVGKVELHAACGSHRVCIVTVWVVKELRSSRSVRCLLAETPAVINMTQVREPLMYSNTTAGLVEVLLPAHCSDLL